MVSEGPGFVAHPDRRIIFDFKEPSSWLETPASYTADTGHIICLCSWVVNLGEEEGQEEAQFCGERFVMKRHL